MDYNFNIIGEPEIHRTLQELVHFYQTVSWKLPVHCLNTHYSDVIMDAMASQITSLAIVYSIVYQAQINENIKSPRHRL